MTGKTDQPPLDAKLEADSEQTEAVAAVDGAAQHAAALQQTLGEIGEELSRQKQATTSAFGQLQDRLESLSKQLEANEKQYAEKLAEAARTAEQAQREKEELLAKAADGGEKETSPAAEASDAPSPSASDGETPSESAGKVAEPAVASSPPPHATMPPHLTAGEADVPVGQPVEPAPAAARAMPARAVPAAAPAAKAVAPAANNYAWERAILGEELAAEPMLAGDRAELVEGLLSGDDTAAAFVGWLLIFSAAPPERVPQFLRDVGEAYYAWRPYAGGDAFRDALIGYIKSRCESAGVGNKIELVQPGDRFDQTRHNSKQRGVEIDDVHGWVVLRDNGKVYTKASVTTK